MTYVDKLLNESIQITNYLDISPMIIKNNKNKYYTLMNEFNNKFIFEHENIKLINDLKFYIYLLSNKKIIGDRGYVIII